jgi:hypothetical protein
MAQVQFLKLKINRYFHPNRSARLLFNFEFYSNYENTFRLFIGFNDQYHEFAKGSGPKL